MKTEYSGLYRALDVSIDLKACINGLITGVYLAGATFQTGIHLSGFLRDFLCAKFKVYMEKGSLEVG